MKKRLLACTFLASPLFASVACSDEASPSSANPNSAIDARSPDPSDDGGGGEDGGGSNVFWYISRDAQRVGVSDTSGADRWSELVEEGKLRSLAIGAGAAWVLTDAGNLLRYDLTNHARVATISVAKNPSHLAFAGGAVWITDDHDGSECASIDDGPSKIVKVDPSTNTIASRVAVTATTTFPCNRFDGLVSDGTSLYALLDNAFGVARIDVATGQVSARTALGTGDGYGAGYLALGAKTLWVHDTSAHTILAVDAANLSLKSTTPVSDDYLGELMIASGEAVYLDKPGTDILRVDANDPTKQEMKAAAPAAPDFLTLRGGALYVTVQPDLSAELLTLDPISFTEKARVELPPLSEVDALVFVDEVSDAK